MTDDFISNAEQQLIGLLRSATPELMEAYGNVKFTEKQDNSVVTHLDKQLEEQISSLMQTFDTGIGIEGEESGQSGNRQTYWLIDPIDGTEQFIRGIPTCRTQLCLVDNGIVVWSLIYYFVTDRLFLARRGKGAIGNGEKLTVTYRPLHQAWIEIGTNLFNDEFLPKLRELREHISSFSIAKDPSLMFCGKIDGIVSFKGDKGGGPWDYAPRSLLYQEAGAKITNIGSNTYDFTIKDFLVSHPKNFEQLMKLLV